MSLETAGAHEPAFVIRDGQALRCGNCHRAVGAMRWDGSGWPHPIVTRSTCVACGRRQVVSLERLEAETLARYLTN
ncbi:MAG TPA: hypothetical protein VKU35_01785 [Candidatus Limnocylindria bacterium]|nr:hypothetical protein [Candidatus Limnocylindria bacterium]